MTSNRQKLIQAYYKNKISNIHLLVDHVQNPHDIAAIARSADGFGIEKIYLYYQDQMFPDMKKFGKKSSASANKWIKFIEIANLKEWETQKKQDGYTFVLISQEENSQPLTKYLFPDKTILVVGERKISPEINSICNDVIFPPVIHQEAKYTLSTYTSMAFYEVFLQHGKHLSSNNLMLRRGRRSQ